MSDLPFENSPEELTGDYYSLLGVPSNASIQDIQKAYRKLVVTFHPDKFQDEVKRRKAQIWFQGIKKAHDVLSNEGTREIYDRYGAEAVDIYLNAQSEHKIQFRDHFIKEYLRARISQHTSYLQNQVRHTGSIVTAFNFKKVSRKSKLLRPKLLSLSVKQSYILPINKYNEIKAKGAFLSSNNFGIGSLKLIYSHHFSPSTVCAIAAAGGWNTFSLQVRASHKVKEDTTGSVRLGVLGNAPNQIRIEKYLNDNVKGKVVYTMNEKHSLRVGLEKKVDDTSYNIDIDANRNAILLDVEGKLQVSKKTALSGSVKLNPIIDSPNFNVLYFLSNLNASLSGCIERKISEITKFIVAFSIEPFGVFVSLGVNRLGQTYQLPLLISSSLSVRSLLSAFFLPLSLHYLMNLLILEPNRRRRREERLSKIREESKEYIKEQKAKAEQFIKEMGDEIRAKQLEEDMKQGLVIVQAFYGRTPDGDVNITEDVKDDSFVDVTLALQYLVRNSKLQLMENTKSTLTGFYDPCPGEEKSLEVVYLFNNQMHRVTVSDSSPLRIPLKSHLLKDTD